MEQAQPPRRWMLRDERVFVFAISFLGRIISSGRVLPDQAQAQRVRAKEKGGRTNMSTAERRNAPSARPSVPGALAMMTDLDVSNVSVIAEAREPAAWRDDRPGMAIGERT